MDSSMKSPREIRNTCLFLLAHIWVTFGILQTPLAPAAAVYFWLYPFVVTFALEDGTNATQRKRLAWYTLAFVAIVATLFPFVLKPIVGPLAQAIRYLFYHPIGISEVQLEALTAGFLSFLVIVIGLAVNSTNQAQRKEDSKYDHLTDEQRQRWDVYE